MDGWMDGWMGLFALFFLMKQRLEVIRKVLKGSDILNKVSVDEDELTLTGLEKSCV